MWTYAARLGSLVMLLLLLPEAVSADDKKAILPKPTKHGIMALIGHVDASLPVLFAKESKLVIYVQCPDAEQVQAVRSVAEKAGLLGTRIYVSHGVPSKIHLADNIVDVLMLTADAKAAKRESLRVVRPGGLVFDSSRSPTVKPFPKNTDEWRHPYHGPDNNPQSQDKVARGPFLTHFMAEPWYAAMPQMSVISGGRIFKVWGNRSSKQPSWDSLNTLICLNAFNGTTLWRRKLEPGFLRHRNTLIATPDTLYFADDKSCQLIDPETGKTRDEIKIPESISEGPVWCWMALKDGVLYALIGKKEPKVDVAKWRKDFRGAGWPWWKYKNYDFGFGRTIVAIDPKTKKVLWQYRDKDYLDMRAMCMRKGRIYFHSNDKFFGCLDANTGKVIWKSGDPKALKAIGDLTPAQHPWYGFITTSYIKCSDDALFLAGPMCKNLVAISAKDGRYLWHIKDAGNSLLVVRDEALYALGGGRLNEPLEKAPPSLKLEPLTGKILTKFPSRDRCTRATGCVDAIFTRGGMGGSTAVFDVSSEKPQMKLLSPMRPACQDGVTIAHGYFFWGPWMCRCDSTQIGVISLGPAGNFEFGRKASNEERLTIAAVKDAKPGKLEITKNDWPTFRRDSQRSTQTPVAVPLKTKQLWVHRPKGKFVAAAPVTAGNLVVTSGFDGVVRAVDAETGKKRWTAYTSGAIKYPPAIAEGRVFIGSGDGYVYCVDATTGRQLWRFQAAPVDRRIPVFGSLMSTWPVGGGVLVDDGTVYAAAGNANYNGTHVYALDAKTGKIRWQNNSSGHRVDSDDSGVGVQSNLLLHKDKLWMQGGNLTGVVSYRTSDGKFERRGQKGARYMQAGRDLYLLGGQVQASGVPLYFRPEDSHFIERAAFPTDEGIVAVYSINPRDPDPTVLVALVDPKSDLRKPEAIWKKQPFMENNAVAIAKNAIIIAGVDRKGVGKDVKTTAGVCALDKKTGKTLWRHDLPADPSGWGIAIDRDGRVLVALQDGRVVCFGK